MLNELRRDCPMRHPDNGNCTVAGGFCTAVNDPICEALHNAYDCGWRSIDPESLRPKGEWINERQLVGGFQDVWGCDCSNCGETIKIDTKKPKFCSECGADMRREKHGP